MEKLENVTREQRQYIYDHAAIIEKLKHNITVTFACLSCELDVLSWLRKNFGDKGILVYTSPSNPRGWPVATASKYPLNGDTIYRVNNSFNPADYPVLPEEPVEPEYLDIPVDSKGYFTDHISGFTRFCYGCVGDTPTFLGFKYQGNDRIYGKRHMISPDGILLGSVDKDSKGVRPTFPEFIRFYNPKFAEG